MVKRDFLRHLEVHFMAWRRYHSQMKTAVIFLFGVREGSASFDAFYLPDFSATRSVFIPSSCLNFVFCCSKIDLVEWVGEGCEMVSFSADFRSRNRVFRGVILGGCSVKEQPFFVIDFRMFYAPFFSLPIADFRSLFGSDFWDGMRRFRSKKGERN